MAEVKKESNNGVKRRTRIGKVLRRKPKRHRPDLLGRFGRYLIRRRKKESLSIRQFAERAGFAHSNIFQFEELRKNPRLTELAKLAKAYEEKLSEFLEQVE